MSCIYEMVCKYKLGQDDQACSLENICKFIPPSSKKQDFLHLTTSNQDIRRATQILRIRRIRGKLTEDQSAALNMYKGIRINKLAEHQRQQILDILNDTKEE